MRGGYQGGSIEIDSDGDETGDRGHVQDQYELGTRSFGQKLEAHEAVKVTLFQWPFTA